MSERERQELVGLWPRVLPFALQVRADLATTAPLAQQEALLMAGLEGLEATLTPMGAKLERLWTAFGLPLPQAVAGLLHRLASVAQSRNAMDFYRRAREACGTLEAFSDDMASYRRLRELAASAPEVVATKAYLEAVSLPQASAELALDRDALLSQMRPEDLAAQPHRWSAIQSHFHWFRSQYRAAYQDWHRNYQGQVAALAAELARLEPEIEALVRLNSIVELGEPLGQGLRESYRGLRGQLNTCSAERDALALEAEPCCSICRHPMTLRPPAQEAAALTDEVRRALAEQLRRLSSEAMRDILARSGEDRLHRLVQVAQTADLSALANVLDEELVAFLRGFLAERRAYVVSAPARAIQERNEYQTFTPSPPLLERLAQKFPTVGQDECPAVVAELASLLDEAFEGAQREQPGKKLRLRLL